MRSSPLPIVLLLCSCTRAGFDTRAVVEADARADGSGSDTRGEVGVDAAVPLPGSLDPSFGGSGYVIVPVDPDATTLAKRVVVDDQGRLVVGGQVVASTFGHDFFLARYSADGVLDTTFGGGIVTFDFAGQDDVFQDLAIDSDQRIVAGGQATVDSDRRLGLIRLRDDGVLDPSFGDGGATTIQASSTEDALRSLLHDSQGRIVFAGTSNDDNRLLVGRLTTRGAPDPSFGANGLVWAFEHTGAQSHSVVLASDDRPVVGGFSWQGTTNKNDLAVARLSSTGALDPTFGAAGEALFDLGGDDILRRLAFDSSRRLVVMGRTIDEAGRGSIFALRLQSDGKLDTSFGSGGSTLLRPGSNDWGYVVLIDLQGRVVILGETQQPQTIDLVIVRLLADGTPDGSFAPNGWIIVDLNGHDDHLRGAAFDAHGRLLVAGWSTDASDMHAFVARFSM